MKIPNCKLTPTFEKNRGQYHKVVKYITRANGYTSFLCEDKIVVSLPSNKENTINAFSMKFNDINDSIEINGVDKQNGYVNYLIGNDDSEWLTYIPTFNKVEYKNIYENIDLYYYINEGNLEYDFVLSKEGNPNDICLRFEGLDNIEEDEEGNLILCIGDTKASLLKPNTYQYVDGEKVEVECNYELDEDFWVRFKVEVYDRELDLVIDPVLSLNHYTDLQISEGKSIAIDSRGYLYLTGTVGEGYPTKLGSNQKRLRRNNVFVTKLSEDGSTLVYLTYIDGTFDDVSNSIEVDGTGCAYITGDAESNDFPKMPGMYLSKLNPYGSGLEYSNNNYIWKHRY